MSEIQEEMPVISPVEYMTLDEFFNLPDVAKELAKITDNAQYQYQTRELRKSMPTFDILSSPDTPPEENKEPDLQNTVSNKDIVVFHTSFILLLMCRNKHNCNI